MSDSAVTLKDLRAGYGGGDVLKGVTADFRRGEVFVLLGPNGAGKSTLIRVLTGALRPTAGDVAFAHARHAVGLAPQQVALYPWLSPSENCFAFGRLAGLSRDACRARIAEVMRLTACEPVARTPVSRLSGGYQRRANIAAALMNAPELLILDEPTAGLDAGGRAEVAAVIAALRAAGAAVLLVTHDFDFAEGLADRVGVLSGGALVCVGPPRELIVERFGDSDRVEFLLKQAPDEWGWRRLAALGAVPTVDPRAFRLWRPRAGPDTRAELTGFDLAEWRVRPAGLEDLFAAALLRKEAA